MKLIEASIRRYRSIEDGSTFAIEEDVTSLVGKNESGKSAVLQALYKSHPVAPGVKLDAVLDFPTTRARERRSGEKLASTVLKYRLEDEDIEAVEAVLGAGCFASPVVAITHGYNYATTEWELDIDQEAVAAHLRTGIDLPADEKNLLLATKSVSSVAEVLTKVETPSAAVTATLIKIKGWRDSRPSLAAIDILSPRRPKFVYFDDYDTMPGTVSIPDLIAKRDSGKLSRSEQAVVSLLELADVELEAFMTPESHEHLVRDSENASNSISEEVFEYWSQNKNLAVKINLIDKVEAKAIPPLNLPPLLQIRVENQRHRVTVPFDERSRGFVWFFSFLAYFSQLEEQSEQPLVLLLDEPGINLHASAQADLLRFIDERLAPKHQVIFSTHSPFMINPHSLERVRTVIDRDNIGTVISSDIMLADTETAFPLHAAIGVDLAQTLFVAPNTLVVEGPSDIVYLEVLSQALVQEGRTGLDERWAVAPIGGISKLPAFVTLLGANRLNIAVLADSALTDDDAIRRLRAAGKLADAGVVLINEIVGSTEADVEDIFEVGFYLKLVNGAYSGQLNGNDLRVGDLPAGDRVTKRISSVFASRGVNNGKLNHYSPAKYLLGNAGRLKLSSTTLDRAETLMKRINARLPHPVIA